MKQTFDGLLKWAGLILPNYYQWKIDNENNEIYLTFDDGPTPELTEIIIEILAKKNVKATFFLVGNNVDKHPKLYDLILENNHSVGNHTYNHLKGWKTPTNVYIQNIDKAKKIIDSHLFRPPYGKMTLRQGHRIQSHFKIIMWTLLTKDYDSSISPEECLSRAKKVKSGDIVVFHDNVKSSKNMLYALPLFIDYALEKGFVFKKL